MSQQDAFDRILASLYEAALDDARWPIASRLIDEACGTKGNSLLVGQGPEDDVRVSSAGLYWRGERHEELQLEYLATYHPPGRTRGAPQATARQPRGSPSATSTVPGN